MRTAVSLALAAAALTAATAVAPQCPASKGSEACCRYQGYTGHEHYYTIHDNLNFWVVHNGRELVLKCNDGDGPSLDDACLPRFPRAPQVRAPRLTLAACALGGGSLVAALRRLGLQPAELRELQLLLPRGAPPASLLDDTARLVALQMLALIAPPGHTVALPLAAATALAQLPNLTSLHVTGVRLPPNATLPSSLRVLRLEDAGVKLSARLLARLPALAALSLRDAALTAPPPLAAAAALRSATIDAPLDGLPELLDVENITFSGAVSLGWRGGCGPLARLRVLGGAGPPPARWLARCPGLRALRLAARGLPRLPPDLLRHTPRLRALDLSGNKLTFVDADWLQHLPQLEELDLSYNLLTADGITGLQALPALRSLQLAGNPLGDLCPDENQHLTVNAASTLAGLPSLWRLGLAGTGAARVCADWPRRPPLTHLDLARNNITQLREADVQWTARVGREPAVLDLRGNPLRTLRLRRADYALLPIEPQPVNVLVVVDGAVACDCRAYWFVLALRRRRLPAALQARCAADAADAATGTAGLAPTTNTIPLQNMTCPMNETEGCPAGCRCTWGAHENATDVQCARIPGSSELRALPAVVRLHAAGAGLAHLPDQLPDNLIMLDVSANNITAVEAAAAAALVRRGRRARLAANPLACACAAGPLLRALHDHRDQIEDYGEVTCDDGRWVGNPGLLADVATCGMRWLTVTLAVAGALLALAATAAALALRRSALLRLKMVELARALCPTVCLKLDADSDESEYDVFLSFAHSDRAVAERVVHVLERAAAGARALRVCLHSRDWRAGDWVPAQIAHSVAVSRRTVVLLSERFARSHWARAELRLAAARALRDSRPRLLVVRLLVVLLDAAPPPLDPELAHYVATHTYLHYSDPRFWPKLRRELAAPLAKPLASPPDKPLVVPIANITAGPFDKPPAEALAKPIAVALVKQFAGPLDKPLVVPASAEKTSGYL